ncbi:amidohydrolase [Gracilibacillus caseinilyticus]|uniref:Amidohydrolase n=1 Tax=Gracilibacillus caseinilyticus TaxID=2932256 RepID=A0ABY4EZD5_9BACI|nr:amidohydrolase [Gracilibacillus caseinilyticus]UOQ49366.1 amidohydrolase [Gracilibacillus caseinilyticus]
MSKKTIMNWLEKNQSRFTDMAKDIWDHPQIAYEEVFASELQSSVLAEEGFTIQKSVGDAATAFVAEYGAGKPIIGILGEFDALPGLSQTVSTTHDEVERGGPGHGCGHNLLGTAGVEAVIALKNVMESEGLNGTIRYYGCPAEEVLSGKTFMARDGVFDDLDCAFSWHPGASNMTMSVSTQSMVSIKFHFKGITAHAAGAPHAGRSALDAVELMNVGANYLREHVLDGSRIHYVITNGGLAPNVVPDEASVWYYLRAATKEQVADMLERVKKIAEGASLMTETTVESEIEAYAYETLPNEVLNDAMFDNMSSIEELVFTSDEQQFARELVETVDPKIVEMSKSMFGDAFSEMLPTGYANLKSMHAKTMGGSTDVGDVSWITPVGQVMTTCAPVGVQVHSWQATAAFGSSIGFKGMHLAAKTMALTVFDLLNDEELLAKAKQEFVENAGRKQYISGIPSHVKPAQPTKTNNQFAVPM